MAALVLPGRGAKGPRPPTQAVLNRASDYARGLIGFWPLSPGGGRVIDLARYGAGTLVNAPTWKGTTLGGQALSCVAASSQYVSVAHSATIIVPPTFTIAFWIYRNSDRFFDGGLTKTAGNQPGPFDIYSSSGTWTYFVGGTGAENITAASVTGPGKWELVVGTCGASLFDLYLQGIAVANGSHTTITVADGPNDIRIGNRNDDATVMDGLITHACLWDRQLSAREVWGLYDPQTRWDLYWVPGRRIFFDVVAAAGVGSQVWWSRYGEGANL